MAKILMLMRHAEAVPSHKNGNLARPLMTEGHRQAMMAGQILKRLNLIPDQVIASPAVRIQETFMNMQDVWEKTVPRVQDMALFDMAHRAQSYGDAGELLDDFSNVLHQAHPDTQRLLVMGHNPVIGNLVHVLGTGLPYDLTINYPSATLTVLRMPDGEWTKLKPASCVCEKVIFNGTRLIEAPVPSAAGHPGPAVK